MGASLQVPFARVAAWPDGLEAVRAAGFVCWAAVAGDAGAALDVAELGASEQLPVRVAIVLGGEGDGLSAEARAACDAAVTIPTTPGFDSLNVATAAAILLHRLGRVARRAEGGEACDS